MPDGRLSRAVAGLFPGCFALVMATGILSVAAWLHDVHWIATPLLFVNVAAYGVLALLTAARLLLHPRRVLEDLCSHQRGPGFFTTVAGTAVLGTQVVLLTGSAAAGWILWGVAFVLWVVLLYGFLTAVTIRRDKPSLVAGLSGTWLLLVVATQSVAVLGIQLAPANAAWREPFLFGTLCLYLVGCLLYVVIITLIVYRFTFLPFAVDQLTPPYWINMGAVAITTLAGALLMLRAPDSVLLGTIVPFLRGFTLLFWAWGTWWIPLLVILGAWRHVIRRHPLRYAPEYWGLVFPIGMYATSTFRLAQAAELPFLRPIPLVFLYVAALAWTVVFLGMVRSMVAGGAGGGSPAAR